MTERPRRQVAAHVQAMIASAAQPKADGRETGRPVAAHVVAAVGLSHPLDRPASSSRPQPARVTQRRADATRDLAPHVAAAISGGAAPTGAPPRSPAGGPPILQRSEMSSAEMAKYINASYSGEAESRNTQAVALYGGKTGTLFTQREYRSFDSAIVEVETKYGITIDERVIGDQKDDEGVHAEMLAVSWWLQGKTEKPTFLAVSQGVCARCEAVLKALGIKYDPAGGHYTANWVHPYRHAGMEPKGALAKLPQKVTKGKEYGWG